MFARYCTQGASPLTELCKEGRFIISNLRVLFLPPIDASVSKATSMLAWALSLQDISYGHITRSKPAGFFKSEKQYLTLHATNEVQFSFRFKHVGGVAAVDVARLKSRLDESLAVIQDWAQKKKKQQQQQQSAANHRTNLPSLPSQCATPIPGASSLRGPQHLPPTGTAHRRVESALVFAPAPPLPRCSCVCACHCMPYPISLVQLPPTCIMNTLSLSPSPPAPQAHASCSICLRPFSSPTGAHLQPKLLF